MMLELMDGVTRMGDASVTLPLAAVVFVALLAAQLRSAWCWGVAVAACGVLTAAGKFGLAAWGNHSAELLSPSGHTASGVLVYGGMALLSRRRAAWFAATCLAGLIAASRLYLNQHTPADVVAGLALGVGSLACFVPNLPVLPAWTLRAGGAACLAVCCASLAFGWSLPIDPWLRAAAGRLD